MTSSLIAQDLKATGTANVIVILQRSAPASALGVRVPAIVVSPWLPHQVCSMAFDHTSLLRLLTTRWGLGPLGARAAAANDLLGSLTLAAAVRTDTPRHLGLGAAPATAGPARPPARLSDNQQAILVFSQYLETLTPQAASAATRTRRAMRSPADANQVARQRRARLPPVSRRAPLSHRHGSS